VIASGLKPDAGIIDGHPYAGAGRKGWRRKEARSAPPRTADRVDEGRHAPDAFLIDRPRLRDRAQRIVTLGDWALAISGRQCPEIVRPPPQQVKVTTSIPAHPPPPVARPSRTPLEQEIRR